MLTDDVLKYMRILDNFHREMILSEIRQLFPSNSDGDSDGDMSSICASSVTAMGGSSPDEMDEGQYFEESECSISSSQSDESMKSSPCFHESFFVTRGVGRARKKLTSRKADVDNIATSLRTR